MHASRGSEPTSLEKKMRVSYEEFQVQVPDKDHMKH